jgi:hypothetical protein
MPSAIILVVIGILIALQVLNGTTTETKKTEQTVLGAN